MRTININNTVDEGKFGSFPIRVFICLFLVMTGVGYVLNGFGVIVPKLMQEWQLNPVQTGLINSYALIGTVIGAVAFGTIADRIGRKKVIIACTALLVVSAGLMAIAPNSTAFTAFRALAGLASGGIMPVLVALLGEYTPNRYRLTVVGGSYLGIQVGAIIATFLGMSIMLTQGWRILLHLFWVAILLIPVLYKLVPESLVYYKLHNKTGEIKKYLPQVNEGYVPQDGDTFELTTVNNERVSVSALFTDGRGFSTVMFMLMYGLGLVTIYTLNTWLPKIMMQLGYPMGSSIWLMTIFYLGAILGTLAVGRAADILGGKKVLAGSFILCAVAIGLLSVKWPFLILTVFIFVAGCAAFGAQNTANFFIPQYYPQTLRATAAGWGIGVGRIGSIIAPTLAGLILAQQLPMSMNFYLFAIPSVIAMVAVLAIQDKFSYNAQVQKKLDV